jgi:hypothetical protein
MMAPSDPLTDPDHMTGPDHGTGGPEFDGGFDEIAARLRQFEARFAQASSATTTDPTSAVSIGPRTAGSEEASEEGSEVAESREVAEPAPARVVDDGGVAPVPATPVPATPVHATPVPAQPVTARSTSPVAVPAARPVAGRRRVRRSAPAAPWDLVGLGAAWAALLTVVVVLLVR